ncbi:hypothetical protein HF086_004614 [Spodoptera exigua]|uniref:Ionotropic receptor n=1 Tax=Spodoptera exigua TaxID=7107 RepID=A0A922MU75_SPOEX|nr:hypothetical protein HF086_004614 [Spodoptera exigua]
MFVVLLTLLLYRPALCLDETNALYKEVMEYHNETASKAEYAYEVVDIMYNSFRQWYFTITFCEFTYFENRILKYTEQYDYGYNVMLLNGCPNNNNSVIKPRYNSHGETAYLVTSNDLSIDVSEAAIMALKRTGMFKPRSAVIFVVKTLVVLDNYFYHALRNHFQLLWSSSLTNSVLILKTSQGLKMYAYNPFFEKISDITNVKDVSKLLSRQYNNLYGYGLRLSVFRKVYVSDKTGPVQCDSNLAKTVIKFMNATCYPLSPRDDSTVGDLLDNGTATGVTADLYDGYTDLELNSRILKNSYYGYIDTTYPLNQDELCFLVKKSETQSTFKTTINLITAELLLLFFFTVAVFIVITIWVRKVETNIYNIDDKQSIGATLIDLIKCFIRQTVDFKFMGPIFRSMVLMIVVYSLIIDCAIDGIITSAVTYPRYKPDIQTMKELGASNLTFGIHNRDFRLFNNSLTPNFFNVVKNRIVPFSDKKIREVLDKREYQYAILLRKTDSQYVCRKASNMEDGKPLFYTIPECPVPCFIVYGLRYGSPYLSRLNYIVYRLFEGGILQYWGKTEEYSVDRSRFSSIQSKDRKPLSITNLQEMFYMLAIGELISAFVFILEIILHKLYKNKIK